MTRVEIMDTLLKKDIFGFEQYLFDGGCSIKGLLERLPLYIANSDIQIPEDADISIELDTSIEGIFGFLSSIYIQTEGDCLFIVQDHPDGSGDAIVHLFFYPSEEV